MECVESSIIGRSKVKSFRDVWNCCTLIRINLLLCGVELVSSAAFTYIPPLLLKAGYAETSMTIILGIAPFLDVVTVPVLARWSDRCTYSIGRRRPVIMMLSAVLLLSLLMIPYGSTIVNLFRGSVSPRENMIILALGVILLDYSYQALFNPCESLLSDLLTDSSRHEQTLGCTIYSACISLGCIIGYLIVSIDWQSSGLIACTQEQAVFFVMFLLFLPCTLCTVLSAKEKQYKKVRKEKDNSLEECLFETSQDLSIHLNDSPSDGGYESGLSDTDERSPLIVSPSGVFQWRCYHFLYKILKVPRFTLFRFFSVIVGVLCKIVVLLIYIPSQYVYGGSPDAEDNSELANLYDEGVRKGSWGLFLHSLTACFYAFLIQQHIVKSMGPRSVFIFGILIFTSAMWLTLISLDMNFLYIVTALSGIGFASLTTTPNMLVTLYNSNRELYMWDENTMNDPGRGLGSDVAVLDMAYFFAQIILSICMGPIVKLMKSTISYMFVAALAGCAATYFASGVIFNEHQLLKAKLAKF